MKAILLILSFLPCLALAGSKSGLEVRFLAERAPKELGEVVLAAGEWRGARFELPVNHLSDPLPVPGRNCQLELADSKIRLANLALPEAGTSFIALLIPAEKGYKAVVMDAGNPSFHGGDAYFYNHSNRPVLGYVGTATFTLKPAESTILRPKGAKPGNYYDVGFGVRESKGDRVLSTTRWPVDTAIRSYVFFFNNPRNGRLDYRAVDEFVEKNKAS